MGTRATRLTSKAITNAKPKEKDYVLSDGDGLQLRVRTNGSRLWNFNYRHPITKNASTWAQVLSLSYLSLMPAKRQQKQGSLLLMVLILKKPEIQSFLKCKKNLKTHYSIQLRSGLKEKESVTPNYADDIWRSLELHIFPDLGACPISKIDAQTVIKKLKPLEAKGVLKQLNAYVNA